ncbi:MAG: hypothetical protein H7124_18265 [Phycisphaerales bacterium]|nr:hypothetical protein [Hyphomonadaceae bacterium]
MRIALISLALAVGACTQDAPTAPSAEESATGPTIVIATPSPGARVTSPLRVEGVAPGDWFFEAVFPAELRSENGDVIAEAPAQAQREWMTEAPVPYVAELQFTVTEATPATLVLQEDMPGDQASPREISIPVVLVPGG